MSANGPATPRAPSAATRIPADLFGDTPRARARVTRLRALDRVISALITVGGIAIILAVLGIFVFVVKEAIPVLLPARVASAPDGPRGTPAGRPLAVGEGEHREVGWIASSQGFVRLIDFKGGRVIEDVPLESLGSATVTCGARAAIADVAAYGTSDGRVLVAGIHYTEVFADGRRSGEEIAVDRQFEFTLPCGGRPLGRVAVVSTEDATTVVGAGDGFVAVATRRATAARAKTADLSALVPDAKITALALDETAQNLVLGDATGGIYRIELAGVDGRVAEHRDAGRQAITALAFVLGSQTLLVGDAGGNASGWQGIRSGENGDRTLTRVRAFDPMPAAITAFAPSARNKSFLIVDRSGGVRLDHSTTERTLASLETGSPGGEVGAVAIAPRGNGTLVADESGLVHREDLSAPHPETTLRSLFLPMLYEGYDRPEFVWQSSGGTDDFEPKFSLVPLIFGSLKGVFYAMLFSAPLAILAALYTSQFASGRLRGIVKPTVELLGAMPSVVVGFLAGLWLAPTVDRNLAGSALLCVLLPAFVLIAFVVLRLLPATSRRRLVFGKELPYLVPFLIGGGIAAILLAPSLESSLFPDHGGSLRRFLTEALGFAYDPRNAIIVGIALGVAVIPIIFTVSEDALSNVPVALRAASAALGASRWQTAIRLVLPAASPGVFAALMLGFGRAIGETMIVVMAAGNTPILDPSPFNGMRTISACIATEIPEAEVGGSLYRVLFLAGAILFAFAFVCNTAAESIGTRLRKRYARW